MRRSPLVLCYHAVSPRWPAPLSVTPEDLSGQLELLLRRGYVPATFTRALEEPPSPRTLVVTFDDAYRSVFDTALPILERLGVPATVFSPTDFVGGHGPMVWPGIERWVGGPHEHELRPMIWEQLGELAQRGWEVGSHTCSHPRLTRLDDSTLLDEMRRSKDACERRLGRECAALAYPYGDFDDRVVEAARSVGYRSAATLPARLEGRDPLRFPRVGVYHRDGLGRYRVKVSPAVRRLRASAAWSAVRGGASLGRSLARRSTARDRGRS